MSRILTGMRPTGRMHIGHYLSVLLSDIELQEKHNCFFLVADLHVLTTGYDKTADIKDNILQMVSDWLAAGMDPAKSTIFIQSQVPIHFNLYLMLSMITPTGWLERNPTVKDMVRDLNLNDSIGHGLLGYPVLQAADILAYKGELVPIGEDQRPHLEIAREVARRFNNLYGETFPEPKEYLRDHTVIPGTDGRKMSKSYDNGIFLCDNTETIGKKVSLMVTDPQKVRKSDPGRAEVCSVYSFHKILKTPDLEGRVKACASGELGCVACKKELSSALDGIIAPVREKREQYVTKPDTVWDILDDGAKKASEFTNPIWNEILSRMGMKYGQS